MLLALVALVPAASEAQQNTAKTTPGLPEKSEATASADDDALDAEKGVSSVLRDTVTSWSPPVIVLVGVLSTLWFLDWWLLRRHPELASEKRLPRQLIMLAMTCLGIMIIVFSLPVDSSTRSHLPAILGVIASVVIGLASTTLFSNAMGSLMLRHTSQIRTGDYLRVGTHFGRVTERGLLHTEIQTENRELTTLPNLYLISTPFTVVRSSGTLISVKLSLGYDVPISEVEPLLLDAATQVGLEEPFVRLLELGDFSITYQVSAFLSDIKRLLSSNSELCRGVVDKLHGAGIEIVSPNFMNQRVLPEGLKFISQPNQIAAESNPQNTPEALMFDKADEAEQLEIARKKLQAELKDLESEAEKAEGETRKRIKSKIHIRKEQLEKLMNEVPAENEDEAS